MDQAIPQDASGQKTGKPEKRTLLLEERPLVILPELACLVGLNQAIVLQQMHFLLQNSESGRMISGNRWIWNTLTDWRNHFPFLSLITIRRTIRSLEKSGFILSCQPDGKISRKKYYRINRDTLDAHVIKMSASGNDQGSEAIKKIASVTDTSLYAGFADGAKHEDHPPSCMCIERCRKIKS